jgi:hydrogenase maturation protein HypF
MGRFFDAVSAMLGLCAVATYEAKAPMRLEGCATDPGDSYPAELGDGVMETAPVIRAVAEDIDRGEPAGVIAGRFHNTVIELTRRVAGRLRKAEGLETVCLSGGAMVNRYLGARLPARLRENGFTVHTHSLLPPNDGGVAVGQMVVAAARREAGKVEGA